MVWQCPHIRDVVMYFSRGSDAAPNRMIAYPPLPITRTAMTLGGAHALFKTSPLERLFRDGAVAPVQFPPRDFCLASLGMLELDLDPRDVLPPLKSDRPDAGPIIR